VESSAPAEQGSSAALPGSVALSAARERRLRWQVRLKLMLLVSRYTSFRYGRTLNTSLRPMLSERTYIVRHTPCLRIEAAMPPLLSPGKDTVSTDQMVPRRSCSRFRYRRLNRNRTRDFSTTSYSPPVWSSSPRIRSRFTTSER